MMIELMPISLPCGESLFEYEEQDGKLWAVREMRCQLGMRQFLLRINGAPEQFAQNERLYRYARDVALANGIDVNNLPKRLGVAA